MTRLFHISDVHFGCEDSQAIDWVRERIAAEKPAAVLLTGDLTMRARTREFQAACDWILSLDAPVTVEVGNHDLPYFNLLERFFTPYRRIRRIERLVERELALPGVSIVPLKTTARAQWRLNWSRGWVGPRALARSLKCIDVIPDRKVVLVTAHHPLVEMRRGKSLTKGGERALAALAEAQVTAVLSGHVHDPFDLVHETPNGPMRMIGAGTLSRRVRSTPCSFNELTIEDGEVRVKVRTFGEQVPTPEMQIDDVPPNALPPKAGEPVAPVAASV
ncbi:metallophosphoesterase [Sphingomonas sp. ID1715]|uniref:metallophosphoesterase family protein n=1 Tax=Sphingomonas sp. ID1715 TaxID=1656898 RepID=UPI001489E54F|nr:metallophosphoesterase [Sphingomonas sp. ID1715]NNM75343.1 metallophosphoesterase [Sphingomonas sp. ID1715]